MAELTDVVCKVEKDTLKVSIPITKGTISSSGKSTLIATSHGNFATGLKVNGEQLVGTFNFFFYNAKREKT